MEFHVRYVEQKHIGKMRIIKLVGFVRPVDMK